MQFVKTHLTKHHLFHAPHRWFLAFLTSPIHAAELHYQKRYRLQYGHAKKLFVFDMTLLLSIAVIGLTAIFWYTYDPTVMRYVELTLSPTAHDTNASPYRLRSGEHVTYTARYKNKSNVLLTNVYLTLQLPKTFLFESAEPTLSYEPQSHTFDLPDLSPGAGGEIRITGFFYGPTDSEERVTARMRYIQKDHSNSEERVATIITILRDSVLSLRIDANDTVLASGRTDIRLEVRNMNHHTLSGVIIPLPRGPEFTTVNAIATQGTIDTHTWTLPTLNPNDTAQATITVATAIPADTTSAVFSLTPTIGIHEERHALGSAKHTVAVSRPKIVGALSWDGNPSSIQPGESATAHLTFRNEGTQPLANLDVSFTLPAGLVDATAMKLKNPGTFVHDTLHITANHDARFRELKPGQTIALDLTFPTHPFITNGTNISLAPAVHIAGEVAGISGSTYETTISPSPLRIGTALQAHAEARYYTDEGDQLGRGPLPPQVGKETKYSAVISVDNTTGDANAITVETILPSHILWTGKKSISHGKDVTFDPVTRKVRWTIPQLLAHEQAWLYLELAFTPTETQRSTTPPLLGPTTISGQDSTTERPLKASAPELDTSLSADLIAKERGTAVQ